MEDILSTIAGASGTTPIGTVFPCGTKGGFRRGIFKITRVDTKTDTVYGEMIAKNEEELGCRWWEYNQLHGLPTSMPMNEMQFLEREKSKKGRRRRGR